MAEEREDASGHLLPHDLTTKEVLALFEWLGMDPKSPRYKGSGGEMFMAGDVRNATRWAGLWGAPLVAALMRHGMEVDMNPMEFLEELIRRGPNDD